MHSDQPLQIDAIRHMCLESAAHSTPHSRMTTRRNGRSEKPLFGIEEGRQTVRARRSAGVGLLIAAAVVASACSSPDDTSGEATAGGVLRFGASIVDCADPLQRPNNPGSYQLRALVDSLLAQDQETGEYVPWLARDYSVNAEATEYTFTVRNDVTFSDGSQLDAQVVAENFDSIVNVLGANAGIAIGYLNGYAGSEAVDDETALVRFEQPNVAFLQGVASGYLGLVSSATTALAPEERCAQGVVGSGAFVLEEYRPTETLRYGKREDYAWPHPHAVNRGPAYLDGIEIVHIQDSSLWADSLLSGQVDAYTVVLPQDVDRIRAAGGEIHSVTNAGYGVAIIPNVEQGPFAEQEVRTAFQIGFDRATAIDGVIGDWFHPGTSPLSWTSVGYVDVSPFLAYDPERARGLLEGVGWVEGPDGVRERDGERLVVDVTWENDWNATTSVLAIIKEQLKDVGIELEINLLPSGQAGSVYESGQHDSRWVSGYAPEPDTLRAVLSIEAGNWNRRTERAPIDDLLSRQVQLVEPEERNAVVAEIQHALIEEGLLIPVYDWAQSIAVSSKVSGVQLAPLATPGPIYSDISLAP